MKASELRDKMYLKIPTVYNPTGIPHYPIAKEMALIAVDELIESHLLLTTTHDSEPSIRCKRYWQEVKQELEKLKDETLIAYV
jgi:hypothetical protein